MEKNSQLEKSDKFFEPPLDHDSKMIVFFCLSDNPQEYFVEYVKANPDSIFNNPKIQMAIRYLRDWCLHPRSASEARTLLKEAGLTAFIPKNLPFRRDKFPYGKSETRDRLNALIKAWTPMENPEEFIEKVKANPESIFDEPDVQDKVRILRRQYLYAPSDCAKKARDILKKIGLGDWLPKDLPPRRTNNCQLRILKLLGDSSFLPLLVEEYKDKVKRFVSFPYGSDVKLYRDVEKAFKDLYKKPLPKELKHEARVHDVPAVAISFIAYKFGIPFFSLRKFYRNLSHFD